MTSILEIQPNDLERLSPADIRQLALRLAQASLNKTKHPRSAANAGGEETAKDDGIDVIVDDKETWENLNVFIPTNYTIIQVKKHKMPPSQIQKEMTGKDELFSQVQKRNGTYIILSAKDNCTEKARNDRQEAMQKSSGKFPNLKLVFYDASRLCDFIHCHPEVILWIKQKLGIPCNGWKDICLLPTVGKFLSNDTKILTNLETREIFSLEEAQKTLKKLLLSGENIRLLGVSGTGKTRFVQEFFQSETNLPEVLYNDMEQENSSSLEMINYLLASHTENVILVLDNCPSHLHGKYIETIQKTSNAKISLLTIDYNAEEDIPQNTKSFRLSYPDTDIANQFLKQKNPTLTTESLRRLHTLTGANYRLGELLAPKIGNNEYIVELTDRTLIKRLFDQNGKHDKELWENTQILSLLYSLKIEGKNGELSLLEGLYASSTEEALYKSTAKLVKKNIAQRRGEWWAIQPQILANHLAKIALEEILPNRLDELCKKIIEFSSYSSFDKSNYLLRPGKPLMSFAKRLEEILNAPNAEKLTKEILNNNSIFTSSSDTLEDIYRFRILQFLCAFDPNLALQRLCQIINPENPNFKHSFRELSIAGLVKIFAQKNASLFGCLDLILAIPFTHEDYAWKYDRPRALADCLLTTSNKNQIEDVLIKLYDEKKISAALLASTLAEWITHIPLPQEKAPSSLSILEKISFALNLTEKIKNTELHRFLFGNPPYYFSVIHIFIKDIKYLEILEEFLQKNYNEKGEPELWFLIRTLIRHLQKENKRQYAHIISKLNDISQIIEPESWDEKLTYFFSLPVQQRDAETILSLTNTSGEIERLPNVDRLPDETIDAMVKIGEALTKENIGNLKLFDEKLLSTPPEKLGENHFIAFLGIGLSLATIQREEIFRQIFKRIGKKFPYESLGDILLKAFMERLLETNPSWLFPFLRQNLNNPDFPLQLHFDYLIKMISTKQELTALTHDISQIIFMKETSRKNSSNTKQHLRIFPILLYESLSVHAKITSSFSPYEYKTLLELIWCTETGGRWVLKILYHWTFRLKSPDQGQKDLADLIEYFLDLLGDSIMDNVQNTCKTLTYETQFSEIICRFLFYLEQHSHLDENLHEKLLQWLAYHLKGISYFSNVTGRNLVEYCPLINYFYQKCPLQTLEALLIPLDNDKDTPIYYCLSSPSCLSNIQNQIFSEIFKAEDLIKWANKNKEERFPLLLKYVPVFIYNDSHTYHPQFLPLLDQMTEEQRKYFLKGDIKKQIEPRSYSGGFFQWDSSKQQNLNIGKVKALEFRKSLLERENTKFKKSPATSEWKKKALSALKEMIKNDCWIESSQPPPETIIFET